MALRLRWRFWPPLQREKEVRPEGSGRSSGLAPAFILRKATYTKLAVEMEVGARAWGRRYVNWPRSIRGGVCDQPPSPPAALIWGHLLGQASFPDLLVSSHLPAKDQSSLANHGRCIREQCLLMLLILYQSEPFGDGWDFILGVCPSVSVPETKSCVLFLVLTHFRVS